MIRGPQGVLLGKNVVGGALSIVTAKPQFEKSGDLLLSYGNYNSLLASGYFTNRLSDSVAGRFSFHDASTTATPRTSCTTATSRTSTPVQARGQLLFAPEDSTWTGPLVVDYTKDSTDGINVVAVDGSQANCEATTCVPTARAPGATCARFLNLTDPRENIAQNVQYAGEGITAVHGARRRRGHARLQKEFGGFAFNSLTGYRDGAEPPVVRPDRSGPRGPGLEHRAGGRAYIAFVAATYGTRPRMSNNGLFLFAEPVGEDVDIEQFSQEFRLTSTQGQQVRLDRRGCIYKKDNDQESRPFIGENFLGAVIPGGNNPLATLSGENRWGNEGETENYGGLRAGGLQVHRYA